MDVPVEPTIPAAAATPISKDERMWGMFAHLSAFAGLLLPFVGHVLGPLVIWLVKRETMPFVNDQGKEALNFQITATIGLVVAGLLVFLFIGVILLPLVGLADVIFTILAAVKANEGVAYRYPVTLRLIK
jgi:uncharacterized Tic20 family protein